jgi:hypothetical protein
MLCPQAALAHKLAAANPRISGRDNVEEPRIK